MGAGGNWGRWIRERVLQRGRYDLQCEFSLRIGAAETPERAPSLQLVESEPDASIGIADQRRDGRVAARKKAAVDR